MKKLLLCTLAILIATICLAQPIGSTPVGKSKFHLSDYLTSPTLKGYLVNENTLKDKPTLPKIQKARTAENGIIAQEPQGKKVTYMRSGLRVFSYDDGITLEEEPQEGIIQVVYDNDGKTVYFKDLISATAMLGSWVKGSLSEDKTSITVPLEQNVFFAEDMGCYMQLAFLQPDPEQQVFVKDKKAKVATFTIEGNRLRLNDSSENHLFGLTFSSDDSWAGYGDYESVYTEMEDHLVVLPEGVEKQFHYIEGISSMGEPFKSYVFLAIDGEEAYMQGACATTSDGWVKGMVKGKDLVFPKGQLTGFHLDFFPVYFMGAKENEIGDLDLCDLTLVYDEAQQQYKADAFIIENANKEYPDIFNATMDAIIYRGPDIVFSSEIISQQPEGEVVQYARSGEATVIYWDNILQVTQNGMMMEVVMAPNSETVYMKNLVSQLNAQTWVKGTKKGNQITMPLYQRVEYNAAEGFGLMTAIIQKDLSDPSNGSYTLDTSAKEITFTIQEDGTITPDGINENRVLGLIYTDNLDWAGYSDWNTVYRPLTEKPQVLPEGAAVEKWAFQYYNGKRHCGHLVQVAFVDNKMYVAGILQDLPTAAIVGEVNGNTVSFASNQFLGMTNGTLVYFNGAKTDNTDEQAGLYQNAINFELNRNTQFMTTAEDQQINISVGQAETKNGAAITHSLSKFYQPVFNLHKNQTATPANPEIVRLDESELASLGKAAIYMNIKPQDNAGRFILPEQLSYQLFIWDGTEVRPYVLRKAVYTQLAEDMATLPYNFSDGEQDILPYGGGLNIYTKELKDIGVQVINKQGDTETRSEIIWAKGEVTGIHAPESSCNLVHEVTYHTLSGVRVLHPAKGVYLKTTTYADGTIETTKILVN